MFCNLSTPLMCQIQQTINLKKDFFIQGIFLKEDIRKHLSYVLIFREFLHKNKSRVQVLIAALFWYLQFFFVRGGYNKNLLKKNINSVTINSFKRIFVLYLKEEGYLGNLKKEGIKRFLILQFLYKETYFSVFLNIS